MNQRVHILVSCRNPELWRASTLVFDSIRKGFPTASIFVDGNGLNEEQRREITMLCYLNGVFFKNGPRTVHHLWIESLIGSENDDFWICDTDVVFWDSIEKFQFSGPLHGRFIPEFNCPFTNSITLSRLHTSLLMINPVAIRDIPRRLNASNPFWVGLDAVKPAHYALDGDIYFHDTLGQAFHAVGGHSFSEDVLECYDHIGCGTYLDLLDESIPGSRLRQESLLARPESARGLWRKQNKWYDSARSRN